MPQLKALLVGVTRYTRPAPTTYIATDRPGAALDVAAVMEALATLVPPAATVKPVPRVVQPALPKLVKTGAASFSSLEVLPLTTAAETTREQLVRGLRWLFSNVSRDHRLLFYFSGHGLLVDDGSGTLDEVLLPSDTDWAAAGLRDRDVFGLSGPALEKGASLDVVLEACSAMAFVKPPAAIRPFGCFLANVANAQASAAVWGASQTAQRAYSGAVPPCQAGPIRGLFTHYFCEHLRTATSRQDLLDDVGQALDKHDAQRERCCESRFEQVPGLYCPDLMAKRKLFSGTGQHPGAWGGGSCGPRRRSHF